MKAASRLISVILSCLVAGCLGLMTPRDLASRKPFFDGVVRSPPDEVLDKCFSHWQSGPYKNGRSAWIQISASEVHYLVDILPVAAGSHVVAYRDEYYDDKSLDSSLLDLKAFLSATPAERLKIEQDFGAKNIYLDIPGMTINQCLNELR